MDGIVDYSQDRIAERISEIIDMQIRLRQIGVRGWTVPQKIDYLTVRAELDQEEFILRVTRPWARDPGFYLSALRSRLRIFRCRAKSSTRVNFRPMTDCVMSPFAATEEL